MTRFHCIDDHVPPETVGLLRDACIARGIEFCLWEASSFDFRPDRRAAAGDLLYRPAVSYAAQTVERHLYVPGVADFYVMPDGVFFPFAGGLALHQRLGMSCPAAIPCHTNDPTLLRAFAERLGGPPLVVKVPGLSGGVGVMRVDSLAALFSLVDYLVAQGTATLLIAYVPDATHWRVVVVGSDAVAAYRNQVADGDFRGSPGHADEDYTDEVPAAVADLAVRAVHAERVEFGGVDILEDINGQLYLLEVNYPCYFAHAQLGAGVDVAGRMVAHLEAKAAR
jgi:RimK-like ATP-grasp domain